MKAVREATISEAPLIGLFGSKAAYQVLMYLENYGQGYAAEIARTFGMSLSQVQNQLRKFLRSALDRLPDAIIQKFYRARKRPRRFAKR